MLTRSLSVSFGLCSALCAQLTFTSPYGYDTIEGNSNHDYILFNYNKMRWQQMDSTAVGTGPKLMKSLAWRRDGSGGTRTWPARSVDITLILADAQPIGATSTDFNANYLTPPVTVFTNKKVNLPDWSAVTTIPAAFDVKLQFDTPWLYLAKNNFLWEVRADNNTGIGSTYGNDFQTQSGSLTSGSNTGTALGTGCVATGQSSPFTLNNTVYNYAHSFRITTSASNGPLNAPAVLHVDAVNQNLTFPGLCGTLYAMPLLGIPLGSTSATGTLSSYFDVYPFNQALVGAPLFLQVAALDAGIPVIPAALSNGRQNVVPPTPSVPGTSRIYEYWITTSMRAPSSWTGGMITQFEY